MGNTKKEVLKLVRTRFELSLMPYGLKRIISFYNDFIIRKGLFRLLEIVNDLEGNAMLYLTYRDEQ